MNPARVSDIGNTSNGNTNDKLTFCDVVAGKQTNPSPISQGLRVAKLWDAIRTSAQQGGAVCSMDAT